MTIESESTGNSGRQADVPQPMVPRTARDVLRPEVGTPPPQHRRSRGSRNQFVVFLNFVVTATFFLTLLAVGVAYVGKQSFDAPGPTNVVSTILIKPNTGTREIAGQLERRGLITDARIFWIGARAFGSDTSLKAGEYEIKPHASMRDIMKVLQSGKSILYSLTIPEGLTVEQALERIRDNEILTGDMPETVPAEGTLAADTQRFTRGTTREQIVNKLLADQKALVEGIWRRRTSDLPIADMDEFVTLASIVEKETGIADERSLVAAVFINRLNKGMRLQSDPTIIYGIYGGKGKPADKPITQSDLKKQTPYNTYLIDGLPPTPIANPGRAALEAVANPSKTEDLYFVADGTGGHVFAKTLEEHNENVARWRAIEKQRADQAAAQSEETPAAAQ
ncbi:MAG: endolytic transglycosylase MltG [Rhizobiaceae bacterium]|nr:endolytic transglycosylase MltG [Rhizobiaceae bacterium]